MRLEISKKREELGGIIVLSMGLKISKGREELGEMVYGFFTRFEVPNECEKVDGIAPVFSIRLRITEDCEFWKPWFRLGFKAS